MQILLRQLQKIAQAAQRFFPKTEKNAESYIDYLCPRKNKLMLRPSYTMLESVSQSVGTSSEETSLQFSCCLQSYHPCLWADLPTLKLGLQVIQPFGWVMIFPVILAYLKFKLKTRDTYAPHSRKLYRDCIQSLLSAIDGRCNWVSDLLSFNVIKFHQEMCRNAV